MEKKVFNIKGMNCEHCVKAVTNALNSLTGLADVTVDLKSGNAAFSYDSSSISLAAIKAAIVDEGYEVVE